jgi:hypothetical protein
MIAGEGQIELNSLEAIYKNNRMLKTVGWWHEWRNFSICRRRTSNKI